jgi:pilus assembly protein Flp/PilA
MVWKPFERCFLPQKTVVTNVFKYLKMMTPKEIGTRLARWLSIESESGVTAIEYGLIAALIAIAIVVSVTLTGTRLSGLFSYVGGKASAP